MMGGFEMAVQARDFEKNLENKVNEVNKKVDKMTKKADKAFKPIMEKMGGVEGLQEHFQGDC